MHLFCEGVMKRLMNQWFVIAGHAKVGQLLKNQVSRRLLMIKKCMPCEFQRKTRSLKSLNKWKATEFRFISFYCGPIVLLNIIDVRRMKNVLLLHSACRVLCNDKLIERYHHHAKLYSQRFFMGLKELYSKIQVMNVHCVNYAADEIIFTVRQFSRISAFPFENFLSKLTNLIRSPFQPLAQVYRRLHELFTIDPLKPQKPYRIQILKAVGDRVLKLRYKQYILASKSPDNFVMPLNKKLFKIRNMTRIPGSLIHTVNLT